MRIQSSVICSWCDIRRRPEEKKKQSQFMKGSDMTRECFSISIHLKHGCLLLVVLAGGYASSLRAQEGLLSTLKERDPGLNNQPYSVSFSAQEQANTHDLDQSAVFMDCSAAQDELGILATKIVYHYEKDPVYIPPGSRQSNSIDYHAGNLVVWRKIAKYSLSSRQQDTEIKRLQCFWVDPNNKAKLMGENTLITRRPIGSEESALEFRQFQLAIGWGYSKHLARSVSTKSVDGFVKMTAEGSYGTGSEGTWELSLDPNSAYLVRGASFQRSGANKPSITITNTGTFSKGTLKIARRGTFEWVAGLKLSVEITDFVAGTPGARHLIDEVGAVVNSPLPKGASILDLRGPRPVRTTAN
jgi:hypothetical protein